LVLGVFKVKGDIYLPFYLGTRLNPGYSGNISPMGPEKKGWFQNLAKPRIKRGLFIPLETRAKANIELDLDRFYLLKAFQFCYP